MCLRILFSGRLYFSPLLFLMKLKEGMRVHSPVPAWSAFTLITHSAAYMISHFIWVRYGYQCDLWPLTSRPDKSSRGRLQLNKHSDSVCVCARKRESMLKSGKNMLLPFLNPHRNTSSPALFPVGTMAVSCPNCVFISLKTEGEACDVQFSSSHDL